MTFELWDTAADRLVAAFETEAAALDAAYRALVDRVIPAVTVRRAPAPASPLPAAARPNRLGPITRLVARATVV